ncbi:MAG TPA: hypothetical protein VED63_09335 [Acidimicrobiales bacterium]|nr:hypothetical protein [Acidimicrobiales bacterium]
MMTMVLLAATSGILFASSRTNRPAAIGATLIGFADAITVVAVLHWQSVPISFNAISHLGAGVAVCLYSALATFGCGATMAFILYGKRGVRPSSLRVTR